MGFGKTMVAGKTYSIWVSMLAHHAEIHLAKPRRVQSSRGLFEGNGGNMRLCRKERDLLKQDPHKWDTNRKQLASKVTSLGEDKKNLAVSLKTTEADLKL